MKYFSFIVVIFTIFHSAKGENNNETIIYLLNNTEGLSRYGSWCQELAGYYNGRDDMTVFAFHDAGYDALPSEERQVFEQLDASGKNDYVRDFTVNQIFNTVNLSDGLVVRSLLGKRLFVNKNNVTSTKAAGITTTFINGVPIAEGIQASNGIIHVLERPPRPISNQNVLEFIESNTINTTIFVSLMERLYMDYFSSTIAPLANERKMTFFLPSQEAMDGLPDRNLDSLSSQNLANVFKMHFIPKHAVFTSTVLDGETFSVGNYQSQITFHNDKKDMYVRAGGVTAKIVKGNIAVDNGVIHIIDGLLGFVYNSALQQINQDARNFSQMVLNASMETKQLITQPMRVSMFVPVDSAFVSIGNLLGVDLTGNQTQIDMVTRLSMIHFGSLSVSRMGDGNYRNRQRRMSLYNNMKLVIYKERNEVWVNGGNVRAKIIRPDVEVTNGRLQYIDRILGIPTMDIPALIYDDDYFLRPHSELERARLLKYLEDPPYDRSAQPPRNVDDSPATHSDTDSTLHSNETLWCDETCSDNSTNYAGCQFTVFLPSSSAFEHFYNQTDHSANITHDICRFRHVLRRHIIPHEVISLEEMFTAYRKALKTDNGDYIEVQKVTENDVIIKWGQQSASVVMWDLGATNGIVHIVDALLTDPNDEWIDIGLSTSSVMPTTTAMRTALPTTTVRSTALPTTTVVSTVLPTTTVMSTVLPTNPIMSSILHTTTDMSTVLPTTTSMSTALPTTTTMSTALPTMSTAKTTDKISAASVLAPRVILIYITFSIITFSMCQLYI